MLILPMQIVCARPLDYQDGKGQVDHSFASFANEWVFVLPQFVILIPSLPKRKDLFFAASPETD
jgi:hypothetical protein